MKKNITGFGALHSICIFGTASFLLFLETHLLIPFLHKQTGIEPVILWFLVAGLGLFLPLLVLVYVILKHEGQKINKACFRDRLRFRKMNRGDWLWSIGSILVIGILSFTLLKLLGLCIGKVDHHPPFMDFETLTPDRTWILLIWLPYWPLNIMGEEICWRGVVLPGQERCFGKKAWFIHGLCWGLFHIAFGWQLLVTLIPVLLVLPYAVQRRKNSWIGVIIHAVINGPSFIAIAFGWM